MQDHFAHGTARDSARAPTRLRVRARRPTGAGHVFLNTRARVDPDSPAFTAEGDTVVWTPSEYNVWCAPIGVFVAHVEGEAPERTRWAVVIDRALRVRDAVRLDVGDPLTDERLESELRALASMWSMDLEYRAEELWPAWAIRRHALRERLLDALCVHLRHTGIDAVTATRTLTRVRDGRSECPAPESVRNIRVALGCALTSCSDVLTPAALCAMAAAVHPLVTVQPGTAGPAMHALITASSALLGEPVDADLFSVLGSAAAAVTSGDAT